MMTTKVCRDDPSLATSVPLCQRPSSPVMVPGTTHLDILSRAAASRTDAFHLNDTAAPAHQFHRWVAALPRVVPYYAVKCNNDNVLCAELAALGAGFDCASLAELQQILALGVAPSRIIHANPCKRVAAIEYSRAAGVARMTFDSTGELDKIAAVYPGAQLVLRLHADDSRSLVRLGAKFGASKANIAPLLAHATALGLAVIGTSFHVGSGCLDPAAFADAIALSRHAFDVAASMGLAFTLLDIGGGYPGTPKVGDSRCPVPAVGFHAHAPGTSQNPAVAFEAIADAINGALERHFPAAANPGLSIIAEPGRYFAQTFSTLAVKVFGRRVEGGVQYLHADTGVYGSLNNIIFDNAKPLAYRLSSLAAGGLLPCAEEPVAMMTTTVWGPTCDSMDVVAKDVQLPADMAVGEWLVYYQMGAYTIIAASSFNGIAPPEQVYCQTEGDLSSASSEDEASAVSEEAAEAAEQPSAPVLPAAAMAKLVQLLRVM
eukprot:c20025_g1_i2.p2 GENE.c20025_g1_i2~~c20025_g1_i2.p2  ORF type:complete len:523 (+),score=116.89 c20025_g1_i2:108-1571(+)